MICSVAGPMAAGALVIALGAAAQWLAMRLGIPSILLLLAGGFLIGPVTGIVDVDALLGDSLQPFVAFAVALILFEGGLGLRLQDLRGSGAVVRNLVSIGALVTWVTAALAAHYAAGVSYDIAALVGAIVVLTGPTVVIPLLQHVRPSGPVSAVLRWEGILIDPIGAVLALLVFNVLRAQGEATGSMLIWSILKTVVYGGGFGGIAGLLLTEALARYWIPDRAQVLVTLALVVATYVAANALQGESGLLAVTAMGMVLANQKRADIHHLSDFKEELGLVLLTMLFLVLSARLQRSDFAQFGLGSLAFVLLLVLVVRPLAVLCSTVGTAMPWRQRAFLMAMAPRGIVAAAVSSEFALQLEVAGVPGARSIVTLVFAVIIGTVLIYGLLARPVAMWLGLAERHPQGLLLVGADAFARAVAKALQEQDLTVRLCDTNSANVRTAKLAGLDAWHGSILSEQASEHIDLAGLGRLLALTPSDEVNVLAARGFARLFGRGEVYQLPTHSHGDERFGLKAAGRLLFRKDLTAAELAGLMASGAKVKATPITEQFDVEDFAAHYGERALPLLLRDAEGQLQIATLDQPLAPRPGELLFTLLLPAAVTSASD